MEHKRLVDLQNLADLRAVERTALTRDERLACWAEVLELDPTRRLKPLHEIEYKKPDERRLARRRSSPSRRITAAASLGFRPRMAKALASAFQLPFCCAPT